MISGSTAANLEICVSASGIRPLRLPSDSPSSTSNIPNRSPPTMMSVMPPTITNSSTDTIAERDVTSIRPRLRRSPAIARLLGEAGASRRFSFLGALLSGSAETDWMGVIFFMRERGRRAEKNSVNSVSPPLSRAITGLNL